MFRRNLEDSGSRGIQGLTDDRVLKWRFDTEGTAVLGDLLYIGSSDGTSMSWRGSQVIRFGGIKPATVYGPRWIWLMI